MSKPLRIYVAGPFTADHAFKVFNNMRIGIDYSVEILKKGHYPFCPWLDYLFILMGEGAIELDWMYKNSMEWLKVCDAIIIVPGWTKSKGTWDELIVAEEMGIPIYLSLDEIPEVNE